MPEGNETPGGEPPAGREGPLTPLGRSERDLLAERRARRAGEGGDAALMRRADAAEATVQTLERHVASLQVRLREAEEEQSRLSEMLEIERSSALASEDELRRVKQREYAEQQLRVEAEERLGELDSASRAEGELVGRRLADGERAARELAERMDALEHQLSETEQARVSERAALARSETELRVRVDELERGAAEMRAALDRERAARERGEHVLERIREGHGRMEALLGEIRGLIARLAAALRSGVVSTEQAPAPTGEPAPLPRTEPAHPARAGDTEMAQALAAAVERLRARAELAGQGEQQGTPARAVREPHKHSMSAIGRWRMRRKQRAQERRGRRAAA